MAIIPQSTLFSWEEVELLGDLERLRLVLEHLPDEELMQTLERERGGGRDDYPIRPVWNSILAGVVYQHASVESLRRELSRNGQLRQMCGFDPFQGEEAVPTAWAYTRMLSKVMGHSELVNRMLDALVDSLREELPDFGRYLAVDGKAIETHARPRKEEKGKSGSGDRRRDGDADWGVKTYRGVREDGTMWEKVKSWFGYKLHLVVDATYELPVAYEVTRASCAEQPVAKKLLERLDARHGDLLEGCEAWMGDKGYDDSGLLKDLWDAHEIKPVIPARDLWDKDEPTRLVNRQENVVYDEQGEVSCYCPQTGEIRQMAYGGFEKDRETLKYRCPARHYGVQCAGMDQCSITSSIRIPISKDRRVFTPLPRSTARWSRLYKKRTAVERVNARLDVSFGFEQHFIRGQKKMSLRCGLALVVMLTMALGRVKEKRKENMRSLVKAA